MEKPDKPGKDASVSAIAHTEIPTLSNPVHKKTEKKGSGWFSLLAIVLSLLVAAGAAAGAYYLWLQQQLIAQQQSDEQALHQQLQAGDRAGEQAIERLQAELRQAALQADKQQQRLEREISRLQEQLTQQQERIQALASTDNSDWLLAELEYLLRLANQRILMGGDSSGAEALLAAADQIVRELDDSALFPVRQAIASDLLAIRALAATDVEGLYLRLAALAAQVDKLPLFNAPTLNTDRNWSEEASSAIEASAPDADAPWLERVQHSFALALKKLADVLGIRVRSDLEVEALLPPQEIFYLRQNLHLMFQQAQSALLSGQEQVYQSSLDSAREWLAKYFQLAGQSTQAVLNDLEQLQKVTVSQPMPDISGSLRALKVYMDARYITGNSSASVPENTASQDSADGGEQ